MDSSRFVQYGCGWCAPESWRNFDASPTLRFERIPLVGALYTKNAKRFPANVELGDIVKGLPVPENSCEAVYCSHVLEHLSLADMPVALRNTYRILRPGGVFRLVVPDLRYIARKYLDDSSSGASHCFMRDAHLGRGNRPRSIAGICREWIGNSMHLWMWDELSLGKELVDAGFTDVRRAAFGDSECAAFADVEDLGRWNNCLGMECRKPDSRVA